MQAVASEGGTDDAKRRGDAFARAFSAHLARCRYVDYLSSISRDFLIERFKFDIRVIECL